ncbi:hypothetical protein ACIBF1_44330 [Spirillospora sp. NPDC050679]
MTAHNHDPANPTHAPDRTKEQPANSDVEQRHQRIRTGLAAANLAIGTTIKIIAEFVRGR